MQHLLTTLLNCCQQYVLTLTVVGDFNLQGTGTKELCSVLNSYGQTQLMLENITKVKPLVIFTGQNISNIVLSDVDHCSVYFDNTVSLKKNVHNEAIRK